MEQVKLINSNKEQVVGGKGAVLENMAAQGIVPQEKIISCNNSTKVSYTLNL